MENLLKIINQYTPLDKQMEMELINIVTKRVIPAGEYLLKAGQISSSILFIEQGAVYYYKIDKEGKERVVHFTFEGDLFSDLESYSTGIPSNFYIKTLEPSIVYRLEKRHLDNFLEKDLRWERLMRLFMQDALIKIVGDKKNRGTLSNTEHYVKLVETYPDLLNRVPLYLIASYLNITPEGLSKIRRRIINKR
ncbi:Crp/Fnr family transcriptional regulator [Aureispira anguillae]|uniref:Crp/Fnr family transcriptional regulator n=1 Tax=Aureispira anguillae TaxID=2864201 RepID=A0A915YJY5_9BACT|nr:Crp/Fnr family transcriptional regulator [Aureispira anguillae]BDS14594.1 Crp/Fnr family transcriptional regulator [Aureispira anguillae]